MESENQTMPEVQASMDAVENTMLVELGYHVDANNTARVIISTSLNLVPEVGFVLSAFVNIFWPYSQRDVWSEIKEKVEELIDEKLSNFVYQQVQEDLEGLKNNMNEYLWAVKNSQAPSYISEKYNIVLGDFLQQRPHFQSNGSEILLLPLFAQFANMHLSLLRDGVLYGANWGWTEEIQQHNSQQTIKTIQSYVDYVETNYNNGLEDTKKKAPSNKHYTEPFNMINKYTREMTLTVLDFKNMWQYFNPVEYPEPVKIYLDREIYSDAIGTADNSGPINLPTPPIQTISKIEVWGWDRIDACQNTYPQGGGPGGVTQTQRMGNKSGGSSEPPHGGVFDLIKRGPIVQVKAKAGDILNAWWFVFSDGSTSNKLGGNYAGGSDYTFSYTDEILSSIKIMGISDFYGSADCAVFGFKFNKESKLPEPSLLCTIYVSSPTHVEPKELATAGKEIQGWAKDYHWDALRQRHWSNMNDQFGDKKKNS